MKKKSWASGGAGHKPSPAACGEPAPGRPPPLLAALARSSPPSACLRRPAQSRASAVGVGSLRLRGRLHLPAAHICRWGWAATPRTHLRRWGWATPPPPLRCRAGPLPRVRLHRRGRAAPPSHLRRRDRAAPPRLRCRGRAAPPPRLRFRGRTATPRASSPPCCGRPGGRHAPGSCPCTREERREKSERREKG